MALTVNAIAPRATTRMTEGLREWTPGQLEKPKPDWGAALAAWSASPGAAPISGRVFEAWGCAIAIAESWQRGAMAEASLDPAEPGPGILAAHAASRRNAGIDRGVELDP